MLRRKTKIGDAARKRKPWKYEALPRHLQLKVKAEVMKAVINAETECLDHEQFRNPTPDINREIAGCCLITTPSPARQTPTPTYFQQL